jgi:hypothetical protein
MICPKCSHTVLSFGRSLLLFYPQHLTCRHCGTELTWSAKWRRVFHWSLAVTAVSAVVFGILTVYTSLTAAIYLACVIVAALIFGWVFWRNSVYEGSAQS